MPEGFPRGLAGAAGVRGGAGWSVSHPLAGTVARDDADDRGRLVLLASAKDLEEHELVVADIAGVLDPRCSELVVPGEPSLVPAAHHGPPGTRASRAASSAEDGRVPGALELVAALHPTPAVGGVPRAEALALIEVLEPGTPGALGRPGRLGGRGPATGTGWSGCARQRSRAAATTIWAGAGIVAGVGPGGRAGRDGGQAGPVLEGLFPGASALLGHCAAQVLTRSARRLGGRGRHPAGLGSPGSTSGIATSKVAPAPGIERTVAEPPSASAMARTIESPSPLPPPVRLVSSRQNRSKTRAALSALSPGPSSATAR